jgi:flavin-dependent dehydrogenase
MDYNLIVIGGGTAGMNALKTAVKLGTKVAVVEENSFAGTCHPRMGRMAGEVVSRRLRPESLLWLTECRQVVSMPC